MLTAKQYLQDLGINKENTLLAVFIDSGFRNPDLEKLMEDFAQEKVKEDNLHRIFP